MAWIVVLGKSTWTYGGKKYDAGKHEVPDAVAERARRAGLRNLLVLDDEPTIAWAGPSEGPLTHDEVFVTGTGAGTYIPHDAPPEDAPVVPRRGEHFCPLCPARFPSQPPLDRHVARHHAVS